MSGVWKGHGTESRKMGAPGGAVQSCVLGLGREGGLSILLGPGQT